MFYSDNEILKEIITNTAILRLLRNGIIHVEFKENSEINRIEHTINSKALHSLVGNEKHPILLDGGEFVSYTKDGLKAAKEMELDAPIMARAFVTQSLAHKLYINFYKRLSSQLPLKTFNNHKEAVDWLLSLKTK